MYSANRTRTAILATHSAALAVVFFAVGAQAQQPAPALVPSGIPVEQFALAGTSLPPVVQGKVKRMLINPYGEVDGLRLTDGTIVKFPPHRADALMNVARAGDMIRVFGRPEGRSTIKADTIVNAATLQAVSDQPPGIGSGTPLPPHLRAESLQPQKVEGRIDAVLTGPRGEANGVILADGSIVRFPPESLRFSVTQGAPFAASGMGTRNVYGTSLEAISAGTNLSALQPIFE